MPLIPMVKRKAICEACGKEVKAWGHEFSSDPEVIYVSDLCLCGKCEARALVWAAKMSLKEVENGNDGNRTNAKR